MALDRVIKLRDRETEMFLDLYRKERVLYDVNLRDYKDKELRLAAAERISEALDIPGFGPREIIYKFKNLRSSYCQELKKIAESERNGIPYKPKVFWFEQMNSFIRPFVQQRNAQPYSVFSNFASEDSNEDHSRSPTQNQEDTHESEANMVHPIIVKTETVKNKTKRKKVLPEPPTKIKKVSQDPLSVRVEDTTENTLDVSSRSESMNGEDIHDSFGRYVAAMLRSIGPPTAIRLQAKITATIANTMCLLESTKRNSSTQPQSESESD